MSTERPTSRSASWLCRSEDERGRLVDMSRRLRRAEVALVLLFCALALIAVPQTGWGLFAATAFGAAFFAAAAPRIAGSRRPEHVSVALIVALEAMIATGVVASSGPRILLAPLLLGPALIAAAVLPARGVVVAVLAAVALLALVNFAIDPSRTLHQPAITLVMIAVLVSTMTLTSAARAADVDSRASAAIDHLTGLLNRAALLPQAASFAHQAQISGEPVGLLIGDIDRFKEINDSRGHEAGDRVLTDVAERLRECLGTAGTLYRFGGEEFVALAPGADEALAAAIAEKLRLAIARKSIGGRAVTISFGTSASAAGERFDFDRLFGAADRALYAAKAGGRNRVCSVAELQTQTASPQASPEADAEGKAPTRLARLHERRRAGVTQAAALHAGLATAGVRQYGRLDDAEAEEGAGASWLMPDESSRAHMLDLATRLRKVRAIAYGLLLAALLVAAPVFGWWPLLPGFAGIALVTAAILNADRFKRPELPLAAALLISFVGVAGGISLAAHSPFVALTLLLPSFFAWVPAFPQRMVLIGVSFELALIFAAAMALGEHATLTDPLIVAVPAYLLIVATAVGLTIGKSATFFRGAAVVDQLTGMLSRLALEARLAAITHEAALSGEPVTIVVGDIDHFKQVNDRAGHAVGDRVLREVAYRCRSSLRAFEAAFRIGGEEFLILLPGMQAGEAVEIAERVCRRIGDDPIEGLAVTMSFGIAGTASGERFDYQRLFAAADASLYEAKRSGRNRVGPAVGAAPPGGPASSRAADGGGAGMIAPAGL